MRRTYSRRQKHGGIAEIIAGEAFLRRSNKILELDRHRNILHKKREEILKSLSYRKYAADLANSRECADDLPAQSLACEISARTSDKLYEILQAIEEALERLENGTFGICVECRMEIEPKRLRAIPWARCCLNCACD